MYLDRNFGGSTVLFDRLFGTYVAESIDEPPVYGLTHEVTATRPLGLVAGGFPQLVRDLRRTPGTRAETLALASAVRPEPSTSRPPPLRDKVDHDHPATQSDVPPIDDWNRLLDGRSPSSPAAATGIGGAIAGLFARARRASSRSPRSTRSGPRQPRGDRACRWHGARARRRRHEAGGREVASPTRVLGTHGRVDVLVNNVGDYRPLVRFTRLDARVVEGDVRRQPPPLLRRDPRLPRLDDRARAAARSSTSTRWRGCAATRASRSTAR